MMPLHEELQFLAAASEELEQYLLSASPTWRLAGPSSLPALSPGYILLYQRRVDAWPWSAEEKEKAALPGQKILAVRARWRSAWLARVRQEIPQRLRLWKSALLDLRQAPPAGLGGFRWQVRWRVMLDLLLEESGSADVAAQNELEGLDRRLRTALAPGSFLWEPQLEAAFPPQPFWYLYLTA
jgi:hypothetical protein